MSLLNFFEIYYPTLFFDINNGTFRKNEDPFATCFWEKIWERGPYNRYRCGKITNEDNNAIMQFAYEYIHDSLKNRTITYNESYVGKILNGLDFFGIEYFSINSAEMERCLDILKKRYELLKQDSDIKDYRQNCLYQLESWNNTYGNECQTDYALNDIFDKTRSLYFEIGYIFANILKHGNINYTLQDLKKIIEDLKLEITRVEGIVIANKSDWMLYDGLDGLRYEFLPHNYARAFLDEFILPIIKNEEKIIKKLDDNIYEHIYEKVGNKLMELGFDYFECCIDIYTFCDFIIKNITEFIEFLKENEKYQESKEFICLYHDDIEISNEYFSLFNYLIETINSELNQKQSNFRSNILSKKCSFK